MSSAGRNEDDRGFRPPVVFLFGPTATGKSALLLDHFGRPSGAGGDESRPAVEVISADSMQVYRHMDIGTAKPSLPEREALPHHLIDLKEPNEGYHVGEFVERAERLVWEITERRALPVIAGGTAFYFRMFLFGLPGTPEATAETRALLQKRLDREGLEALRRELEERDPESAARIAPRDSYRVLRALEVLYETGTPRSAFAVPETPRRDMDILSLGLYREREELYRRIDARVDKMMSRGLPAEVRRLVDMGHAPPDPGMRAIGYREFFHEAALRDIDSELPAITELIRRDSRRYAKRQLTFFRKLPRVEWFHAGMPESVAERIRAFAGEYRS